MKNLTFLVLLLVLCALALSKDYRKRRSYSTEDVDTLETLLRAIENGEVDLNQVLKDDASEPGRRILFRWRWPWRFGKK